VRVFQPSRVPSCVDPEAEFRELWGAAPPPSPPSNSELRARFILDQESRGLTAGTVGKRENHLRAFGQWLAASYFTATTDQIVEFLDARQLGHKARYCWISDLHCFYRWAIDSELTERDPTSMIERPKAMRTVPRPARSDQLADAIERAAPMVRCWILLAAFEGLKVSEIARLRWEDVLVGESAIRVRATRRRGRSQCDRFVRLHPAVLEALLTHAGERPLSGWVFTRPLGGPYSPERLSNRFCACLVDLGVNATANQLRGWFATNLYAATKDLGVVQTAMGHATPATTANNVIPG